MNIEEIKNNQKQKHTAAIMGFVVADALGVPVEFMSREELSHNLVTDIRGYGTHNQPPGTWSDDSSMTIATMEWYCEKTGIESDYNALMDKFSNWLLHGEYTPYGETFDCGISTNRAIMNYAKGMDPLQSGGVTEYDNGNGSLMRILPGALWHSMELTGDEIGNAKYIYELSSLTHAHPRSLIGCLIYSKIIADMMHMPDDDKYSMLDKSLKLVKSYLEKDERADYLSEINTYGRLWDLQEFIKLPGTEIKSSGYIVDTLEAAIWCFHNTNSYKECVLKAVNMGEDTDTVGAVTGGLAGLYYGYENIPKEWLEKIPKKDWIIELANKMVS